MSRAPSQVNVEAMERAVLAASDVDAEHVPDEETEAYDAHTGDHPIEIKTCQRWIHVTGSNGDRRRGRWHVSQQRHRELVDTDGAYLLAVLSNDTVLETMLVDADALDPLPWTTTGETVSTRDPMAIVPWSSVIEPSVLPGSDDA